MEPKTNSMKYSNYVNKKIFRTSVLVLEKNWDFVYMAGRVKIQRK